MITFLDSDELSDEVMYYPEMLGFLTSLAIVPVSIPTEKIVAEIAPDTIVDTSIQQAIIEQLNNIKQSLLGGEFPDIDEPEPLEEDTLVLWCAGFMQGIFFQEDSWFSTYPDDVAELTLPILSCSELVNDELSDIAQEEDLLDAMAEKIPECVIDLYLLLNAPEG